MRTLLLSVANLWLTNKLFPRKNWVSLVLILCISSIAKAQPANNDCSNAILLTSSNTCTPISGTTVNATNSIPAIVCGLVTGNAPDDVWYKFVAVSTTETIRVVPITPTFDPVLDLRSGACPGVNIGCTDNSPFGVQEVLTQSGLTIGQTYYIRIYNYSFSPSTTSGAFDICVTHVGVGFDECSGAILLTSALNCNPVSGTTVGATNSIPPSCGSTASDDVWYKFVATNTKHEISVHPTSSLIPIIDLRSGSCPGVNIGCESATSPGPSLSLIKNGLTVGQTYYIRIYGNTAFGSNPGSFDICVKNFVANDECENATLLSSDVTCNPIGGTTFNATGSGLPGAACGGVGQPNDDVWYKFVAASTTETITVTPTSPNQQILINLRSGACPGTTIGCANSNANGVPVSLTQSGLTIGQTYIVRVYHVGSLSDHGPFDICVTHCSITCPNDTTVSIPNGQCGTNVNYPPVITNGPCSGITFNPTNGSFFTIGTHPVNVTSSSGETCSFNVTVSSPSTVSNIYICAGDSYTPPGGIPMTTSGTQTSKILSSNGCDSTIVTNLTVYDPIVAIANQLFPIDCYNSGTCVEVCATGGKPPYMITPPNDFTSCTNICNVLAGTGLSWVVIDSAGCSVLTTPINITQPTKLEVNCSAIAELANGNNGSVSVTAAGGTFPYLYNWYDSLNILIGTNASVNGLKDGTYHVVVTDALHCPANCTSFVKDSCSASGDAGVISGVALVCKKTCVTYSVPADPTALSYQWLLPAGATGSSNGPTITVCYGSKFIGGYLCVKKIDPCGPSIYSCKTIVLATNKPNKPSVITGESIVCTSVANTQTYCVASDPIVTNYSWAITGNANPSLSILAGQGTNCITIQIPVGYNGNQKLKVTPSNCKGTGAAQELSIKKATTVPTTTLSISGPNQVCKSNFNKAYSAPYTNASSYNWTISGNAIITSGQGTKDIKVDFRNATDPVVFICVTATNGCGTSAQQCNTISVILNCRMDGNPEVSLTNLISEVSVYPNPTNGKVKLQFTSINNSNYRMNLYDMTGRVVFTHDLSAAEGLNQYDFDLSDLPKQVYVLRLENENGSKVIRVGVE